MTILAVTGLDARSRASPAAPAWCAVAGGGDAASRWPTKLDALHGDIARRDLTSALAGALSPLLKVGDVVIADAGHHRRARHCATATNLARAPGVASCRMRASGPDRRQRRDHRERRQQSRRSSTQTGALAVDMETQVAARFAARTQPAVRGAAGDFRRCRPCAAAGRPGGDEAGRRHRARPRAGSLLRKPLQVPALIRTARESEQGVRGTTPLPRSLWCWTCRSVISG